MPGLYLLVCVKTFEVINLAPGVGLGFALFVLSFSHSLTYAPTHAHTLDRDYGGIGE